MVMKRTFTLAVVTLACLCAGRTVSAHAASSQAVFGPVFSVGDPLSMFGGLESEEVESPLAGMDGTGRATVVWLSDRGGGTVVDAATIPPGGTSASAIQRVSSGPRCYSPALVVPPSGRAIVAWLQTQNVPGTRRFPVVALRMSEEGANGRFGRPVTIWRSAEPAEAEPLPGVTRFVAIAGDASGDVAIAWSAGKIMVATRQAGGGFTDPMALPSSERATPALAMDASGQATAMWREPHVGELRVSSWMAGGLPAAPTQLEEESAGEGEPGDLRLVEDAAGDELAVWLTGKGLAGVRPTGVLRAVWRSPTGAFGVAQTLSAPGVQATEPTIALGSAGRALVGWSEVTSSTTRYAPKYDTPYEETTEQIRYAIAAPGGQFPKPTALGPRLGQASNPDAAWLLDGSALLAWEQDGEPPVVAHLSAGNAGPAVPVSASGYGAPVIAAGGASDPVIAWTSSPWENLEGEPLHYAVANGLDGPEHAVFAPILEIPQPGSHLERGNDLDIAAECAERCQLTATGELLRETGFGTDRFTPIAALPKLHHALRPDRREDLQLVIPRRLRSRRYCDSPFGFRLTLTVRGPHGAITTTRAGGVASCRRPREPSE